MKIDYAKVALNLQIEKIIGSFKRFIGLGHNIVGNLEELE